MITIKGWAVYIKSIDCPIHFQTTKVLSDIQNKTIYVYINRIDMLDNKKYFLDLISDQIMEILDYT